MNSNRRTRLPRILILLAILAWSILPSGSSQAAWPPSQGSSVSVSAGAGDEEIQDAASDGEGGMLVVWTDDRGADQDIYVQRVGADGTSLWGTDGIAVCTASGIQDHPRVIADGAGGAIIVWHDERDIGTSQTDIYAQRIDRFGATLWGLDGAVVCDAFNHQTEPKLVPDGSGGAVVVWLDPRTGQNHVWGQRLDANGTGLWAADGTDLSPGHNADFAEPASDGLGGAWFVFQEPSDRILRQHVDGSGALLLGSGDIIYSAFVGPADRPAIVADGLGGYWIAFGYEDVINFFTEIDATRYDENDNAIAGNQAGSTNAQPKLVADGTGGLIVAYPRTLDIRVTRLDGGGTLHYSGQLVNVTMLSGEEQFWGITSDGAGGAMIAALDGSFRPTAFKLDPAGGIVWGSSGRGLSFETTRHPFVVSDGSNGLIAAWDNDDAWAQRVERHGYLGDPGPTVSGVVDHPGDQGGTVLTTFDASYMDTFPNQLITHYSIWRQDASGAAKAALEEPAERTRRISAYATVARIAQSEVLSLMKAGWELTGTQISAYEAEYTYDTPTYFDAVTPGGAPMDVKVLAHTADPFVYFGVSTGQGESSDNLAPTAPLGLLANYSQSGTNSLEWEEAAEEDVIFFRIYRGNSPEFVADATTFVDTSTDLSWIDPSSPGTGVYYKVSAVDDAYNEGPAAAPGQVTDAPSVGSPQFALHGNVPNPFNPSTEIRFELATRGQVRLDVYDLAGHRVATLVNGALPAGLHSATWQGLDHSGRAVSSGVYLYRVESAGQTGMGRMALIK